MIGRCGNMTTEEKKVMARDIAEVRVEGTVNMFDRHGVIEALYLLDKDDTAYYLYSNKNEYMELLKLSGNWQETKDGDLVWEEQ